MPGYTHYVFCFLKNKGRRAMTDDEASKHMIPSHGCEPPNQMRIGSAKHRMECESNNNKMDFEQHQDMASKNFQHPTKAAGKMDAASHSVYHEHTMIDEKASKQPKQLVEQQTTVQPILSPQIPQQPIDGQSIPPMRPYQTVYGNQSLPENSYNIDNTSSW